MNLKVICEYFVKNPNSIGCLKRENCFHGTEHDELIDCRKQCDDDAPFRCVPVDDFQFEFIAKDEFEI